MGEGTNPENTGGMQPITAEQASGTALESAVVPHKSPRPRHLGVLVGGLSAVIVGLLVLVVFLMTRGQLAEEIANEDVVEETAEVAQAADLIELDPAHALVQGVYQRFLIEDFVSLLGQIREFYTDEGVKVGTPSSEMMLDVALLSLEQQKCQNSAANNYLGVCYQGEAVRGVVQRTFGQEIKLGAINNRDGQPALGYDSASDELYMLGFGIGGMDSSFVRALTRAELGERELYLYEVVGERTPTARLVRLGTNCTSEAECGRDIRAFWNARGTWDEVGIRQLLVENQSDFDTFKWIFSATEDGDYVFASLEAMN